MSEQKNPLFYCRVCGFYHGYSVWGETSAIPDRSICDCCGCESGLDDESLDTVRRYRTEWLGKGAIWFTFSHFVPLPDISIKTHPANWSLETQLEQIPPEWR
jgi:hypothetical protein